MGDTPADTPAARVLVVVCGAVRVRAGIRLLSLYSNIYDGYDGSRWEMLYWPGPPYFHPALAPKYMKSPTAVKKIVCGWSIKNKLAL